jgi:DNA invertase Pin-like site-specific DNA recombinase
MGRVIAYIRVSTSHQDVDNQRFEINHYAEREHIHIDEFIGETISGYKTQLKDRKFSELITGLERGDTLIVSETSRISRRLIDVLNTIQGLLDRGVNIIAVKEGIVFKDDINSKVLAFAFGLSAEIERNLISARTREALAKKKADGVKLGRPRGSARPENLLLHGRQDEYVTLRVEYGMSKAAIARRFDVNIETLRRFVDRFELDKEVLWRRRK